MDVFIAFGDGALSDFIPDILGNIHLRVVGKAFSNVSWGKDFRMCGSGAYLVELKHLQVSKTF